METKIPRKTALFLLKYGLLNRRRAQIFCQEFGGCVACDEGRTHASCDFVHVSQEDWLSVETDKNLKTFKIVLGSHVKTVPANG